MDCFTNIKKTTTDKDHFKAPEGVGIDIGHGEAETRDFNSVLGRVKNFIGIMAEANKQLEQKMQENPNANYDIEALSGNETELIEMDLLLGVADLQTADALTAAEAAISGSKKNMSCSSNRYNTDDSSGYSSSEDARDKDASNHDVQNGLFVMDGRQSSKRSRARQPNKRPKIVMLN